MRGFLCQSQAATSVCVPGDPRSMVAAPRIMANSALDLKYSLLPSLDARTLRRPPPTTVQRHFTRRREVNTPAVTKKKHISGDNHHRHRPETMAASKKVDADAEDVFQVVVMRVSIHCEGCAGKVKKHISKMEGVTSFSIDLESKRVTVMGHVSPVGVLESISKVKKAEFWSC